MLTVTKQYRTETGHRLTCYDGKCSHLHGHSYLWEVTATAPERTDNGMIVDFKDLKWAMKMVLEPLDHAMVLAPDDPLWMFDTSGSIHGELAQVLRATNGQEPRLFKWHENPTAESFAEWALREIDTYLPIDVTIARVRVWETATSFAEVVQ